MHQWNVFLAISSIIQTCTHQLMDGIHHCYWQQQIAFINESRLPESKIKKPGAKADENAKL